MDDRAQIHRENVRRLIHLLRSPKHFPVLNPEKIERIIESFALDETEILRVRAAILATSLEKMLMDRVSQWPVRDVNGATILAGVRFRAFLWGRIDSEPDRNPIGPFGQHAADTPRLRRGTSDLPIGQRRRDTGPLPLAQGRMGAFGHRASAPIGFFFPETVLHQAMFCN